LFLTCKDNPAPQPVHLEGQLAGVVECGADFGVGIGRRQQEQETAAAGAQ
jgi:hypothetical protein